MKASHVSIKPENQSINSSTDKKERNPGTPIQTYNQLLLPINMETQSSLASEKYHSNDRSVQLTSSNSLSPDIQKEAVDYLFQLKTQSQRLSTVNNDPILVAKNLNEPYTLNCSSNINESQGKALIVNCNKNVSLKNVNI